MLLSFLCCAHPLCQQSTALAQQSTVLAQHGSRLETLSNQQPRPSGRRSRRPVSSIRRSYKHALLRSDTPRFDFNHPFESKENAAAASSLLEVMQPEVIIVFAGAIVCSVFDRLEPRKCSRFFEDHLCFRSPKAPTASCRPKPRGQDQVVPQRESQHLEEALRWCIQPAL
jgi:hypothetical protein